MQSCYIIKEYRAIADLCDAREMGLRAGWVITRINVPREHRGQGIARRLLKTITDTADAELAPLYLEISPSGGLTYEELEAWYRRAGFKPLRKISTIFCRRPQPIHTLSVNSATEKTDGA